MLPKKYRLTKKTDFDIAIAGGRKILGRYFVVYFARRKLGSTPLLGVIVSTRVSKSAVKRNALRRIVRMSLRSYIESLGESYLFVYIAKPSAVSASKGVLVGDVADLFLACMRYD